MRPVQFPLVVREGIGFVGNLFFVVRFGLLLFLFGVILVWLVDTVANLTPSGVDLARGYIHRLPRHLRDAAGW